MKLPILGSDLILGFLSQYVSSPQLLVCHIMAHCSSVWIFQVNRASLEGTDIPSHNK